MLYKIDPGIYRDFFNEYTLVFIGYDQHQYQFNFSFFCCYNYSGVKFLFIYLFRFLI